MKNKRLRKWALAADENIPRWRESGTDVLIGTSGYTVARIDALRSAWSGLTSRWLVVPNFAVGAVLMIRFAELDAIRLRVAAYQAVFDSH